MKNYGLIKLPYDKRDFSHHKKFGTLLATQIPTNDFTVNDEFLYTIQTGETISKIASKFGTTIDAICKRNAISNPDRVKAGLNIIIPALPIIIQNQTDLDFCPAYSIAEIQHGLWGNLMSPLWQMAKIKEVMGEYLSGGADLRSACKSTTDYGSIPNACSPFTHNTGVAATDKDRNFLANWLNWPISLDGLGKTFKDLSYFAVDGSNDFFDNIRSTLAMHSNQRNGGVIIGLEWQESWTYNNKGIIPDVVPTTTGDPHAMRIIGQKTLPGEKEPRLVFQQSWGTEVYNQPIGDNGLYYFPRSVVNHFETLGYGCFTLSRTNKAGLSSIISGIFYKVISYASKLLGISK